MLGKNIHHKTLCTGKQDCMKYKCLVLAVKHGSVILCGKGHCFSVRGRHLCMCMKVFLGMLKIGPANLCINKLIWSGLTTMYYSLHSFYLWIWWSINIIIISKLCVFGQICIIIITSNISIYKINSHLKVHIGRSYCCNLLYIHVCTFIS